MGLEKGRRAFVDVKGKIKEEVRWGGGKTRCPIKGGGGGGGGDDS